MYKNKMNTVLAVPLNTNHVLIMKEVLKHLNTPWKILCYDKISGGKKYHTEAALKKNKMPYFHFPRKIRRKENSGIFLELMAWFRLKKIINELINRESPSLLLLAIENDPISHLLITLAQKKQIKTVIIQEGSTRPEGKRITRGGGYIKEALRLLGIQLGYLFHGENNRFDKYCVAGPSFKNLLVTKRGVSDDKIVITGQPKVDPFFARAEKHRTKNKDSKILLFAAGPARSIISNEANIFFLKGLVKVTKKLNLELIIKLHPRSPVNTSEIITVLEGLELSHCDVIKEGDETFNLLVKSYGVITPASTVVTEALILDREGILVDYLAGGLKLPFGGYDAVHHINCPEDISSIISNSIKYKKAFQNKKNLLENNLYKLDGKAGERVAKCIESLC